MNHLKKKCHNKKDNEKYHAKQRFYQRFGVTLKREEYFKIVDDIQKGKMQFLSRQSNRISRWRGEVKGIMCIVIYDKIRKRIVTFIKDSNENRTGLDLK